MTIGLQGYSSWGCDVSPDGRYLAFSGTNFEGPTQCCLNIFDLKNGNQVNSLKRGDLHHSNVAKFSHDGQHLCLFNTLTSQASIVEFPSLNSVTKLSCDGLSARTACWSKNNETIFIAGDEAKVLEFDTATGEQLHDLSDLSSFGGAILGLKISADGKRLFASTHWGKIAGEGERTTVYDISGETYSVVKNIPGYVLEDTSPEDQLSIGRSKDRKLSIRSLSNFKKSKDFPHIAVSCAALAVAQYCFLVGETSKRLAVAYDLESGDEILRAPHRGAARQIGCLPNAQGWFSMGQDGVVKVYDWKAVQRARSDKDWRDAARVPLVRGKSLLPFNDVGEALICNGSDCTAVSCQRSSLLSFEASGNVVDTSDGQIAIACADLNIDRPSHNIDLCSRDGQRLKTLSIQLPTESKSQLHQVELSPDGRWLVAKLYAGKQTPRSGYTFRPLLVVDLNNETRERKVLELANCMDFDISTNGKLLLTCSQSGYVCLWDLETGFLVDRPHGSFSGSAYNQKVAFSPDCSLAATGFEDGSVKVWPVIQLANKPTRSVADEVVEPSLKSRSALASFSGQTGEPTAFEFFPDSNLIAIASGKTIRLLDVKRKQERISLPTPGITKEIVITKDGRTLLALQDDGRVVYFRTNSNHCNWQQKDE